MCPASRGRQHLAIANVYAFLITLVTLILTTTCRVNSTNNSTTLTKITALPLSITTQTLPTAATSSPYNASLAAAGGVSPYSWAVSSGILPNGFGLVPNTGVLSGTTTEAGTFAFQITVTDSERNQAIASLSVLVQDPAPPLSITTQALPTAATSSPYNASLAAAGGVSPYSWEITSGILPDGITLGTSTGLLSGTTNETGVFSFQVDVTDSQGNLSYASLDILVLSTTDAAVELPQNWVNGLEWAGTTANVINFPSSGAGGVWTCGTTGYGPYTANSQTSAAQAVVDAEACRAANGSGTTIVFPAGALYSGANGIPLPQTAGDNSTNFIVLTSSSPLPAGQTVCSHGTQDNVAESTQPGIRNPGCNGSNLSYQNGTSTVTAIPAGAFTLANGTVTNTSAYNDVASMWGIEYTGGTQGITVGQGTDGSPAHHYAIVNAHVFPTPCTYSAGPPPTCTGGNAVNTAAISISTNGGVANITSLSQLNSHVHFVGDYISDDWTDTTTAGYPVGSNSTEDAFKIDTCTYCSIMYSYTDRMLGPGQETHQVQLGYSETIKEAHNWFEGSSIGTFCGGYGVTLWPGAMLCTDIEDRANRYTYPYSWMVAQSNGEKPNDGSSSYVRKNASELKAGLRYLRDGNIYENVDNSGAQNGVAFTAKTSNGSGTNFFLSTTNLTMTNNVYRQVCNGPDWGDSGSVVAGFGSGNSLGVQDVLFQNNLGYNIGENTPGCAGINPDKAWGAAPAENTWPACTAVSGASVNPDGTTPITLTCAAITNGPQLDMENGWPVVTNSCSDATFSTPVNAIGPPAYNTTPTSLTLSYNLAGATLGESGVTCAFTGGTGAPFHSTVNHNTFIAEETGATPFASCYYSSYQAGSGSPGVPFYFMRNFTVTNNLCAQFSVEANLGSQGFYSQSGEGTTTLTENFDSNTFHFNNNAITGRSLHGIVNCAPSGSSDICTLVSGDAPNGQSSSMVGKMVSVNGVAYGPVGSGITATSFKLPSSSSPGTVTNAIYLYAQYTEYGGTYNNAVPPVTDTFPASVQCAGSDPTGTSDAVADCIGMIGAMSTFDYPLDLSDWNQYRLCHTGDSLCNGKASLYAAGESYQAADGTDVGAHAPAVNAAETSNQYVCATSCGQTGPYPDH